MSLRIFVPLAFVGVATALTGEFAVCNGDAGICIDTNTFECDGRDTTTGDCPGGSSIRCCPKASGFVAKSSELKCQLAAQPGACKLVQHCVSPAISQTGLCPGPAGVQCCSDATICNSLTDNECVTESETSQEPGGGADNTQCGDSLPSASRGSCPQNRRLTSVCKEMGAGSKFDPPQCRVSTTQISSSVSGYVCQEGGTGSIANNWNFNTNTLPQMTRTEMLDRAKPWVDEGIRYSQRRYHSAPNYPKKYRTDCSGFISMAWKLPASFSTSYACCTASSPLFERISCDDLEPGDSLVTRTTGHILLFHSWQNQASSNRRMTIWEESGHAKGTIERTYEMQTPGSSFDSNIRITGTTRWKGYRCIRRKNIIDEGTLGCCNQEWFTAKKATVLTNCDCGTDESCSDQSCSALGGRASCKSELKNLALCQPKFTATQTAQGQELVDRGVTCGFVGREYSAKQMNAASAMQPALALFAAAFFALFSSR
jgi:hypothetical protein